MPEKIVQSGRHTAESSAEVAAAADPPAPAPGSSEVLHQFVDHLPAGAVYIRGDRIYLNRAAEEITGYRRDELQTVDQWFQALYGDKQDEIRQIYESNRASGFTSRTTVHIRRKSGEDRAVEFAAHRFENQEVWLIFDVTEQDRAEKALRESEDRLRAVVDTAVEAFITIDPNGTILSFNRAAERMFGYTQKEAIGQNVRILMPSPHREQHQDYVNRYLQTGEARIIGIGREMTALRKDGSIFPIELAVGENAQRGMFTGVIRDISERKDAEERLRQADRLSAIGTLAAGLGHDLNNVLLPVRARLDAIERAELPASIRAHFNEIRKSAKYLQDLSDGLHMLALDPDDSEASSRTTYVYQWWEQVHTLLDRALPRGAVFSATLSPDLPEIPVPEHRLTQAILNMLINSGKAIGREGTVRLWADTVENGRVVRIGVTDNGSGMTPEVQKRALEPFFTTNVRGLGTGLGLSLVHGVVKSAGGSIHIDSEPGKGTTIVLSFPAVTRQESSESDREPANPTPRAEVNIRDLRRRSLVRSLLEMAGFEVHAGADQPTPGAAAWVADADNDSACNAHETAETGCRVILLGDASATLDEPGVTVVTDPDNFDALRTTINNLAAGVLGQ